MQCSKKWPCYNWRFFQWSLFELNVFIYGHCKICMFSIKQYRKLTFFHDLKYAQDVVLKNSQKGFETPRGKGFENASEVRIWRAGIMLALFSILRVLLMKTQMTLDIMSKVPMSRAGTNESACFGTSASSLVKRNIVRIKCPKFGYD